MVTRRKILTLLTGLPLISLGVTKNAMGLDKKPNDPPTGTKLPSEIIFKKLCKRNNLWLNVTENTSHNQVFSISNFDIHGYPEGVCIQEISESNIQGYPRYLKTYISGCLEAKNNKGGYKKLPRVMEFTEQDIDMQYWTEENYQDPSLHMKLVDIYTSIETNQKFLVYTQHPDEYTTLLRITEI